MWRKESIVAGLACCLLLLVAGVAMHGSSRTTLMSVFGNPPADPIVSPLLMGYNGGDRLVRELARVAGPLGGAWAGPQSSQLYSPYRGMQSLDLPRKGQNYENAPTRQLGDIPLTRSVVDREATSEDAFEYPEGATSEDAFENPQSETADVSTIDSLKQALGYTPKLTRHATNERVHLEEQVPDSVRKLLLGSDSDSGFNEQDLVTHASSAQDILASLKGGEDREEAKWLLQEKAVAQKLQSGLDHELSLKPMEGQLEKAVRISEEKQRKARQMHRDGLAELANYHQEVSKQEKESAREVRYLRASHNYAQLAQKEMEDAVAKQAESQKTILKSDKVLELAHEAEVKAHVTGDANALATAREDVNEELSAVKSAESAMLAANNEKADAKYNSYMSQVIDRVRLKHAKGAEMDIGDLSKMSAEAHHDLDESEQLYQTAQRTHQAGERWLRRAKWQDAARGVAKSMREHADRTIHDMEAIERDQGALRASALASSSLSSRAKLLEVQAKRDELAAASLAPTSSEA